MSAPHAAYDRSGITAGIAHFGVGGFHRAHEAAYLDSLMAQGKALDWGIVGVGTMPGDAAMRDALAGQDHLYTLVVKHPDGRTEPRTIGSIIDYRFAPDDPEAVLTLLADPSTRIVSLTVTEGGYHVHPVTGELDATDEGLTADLATPEHPRTAFGFLVEGLARRRAAGTTAYTVMSCDNVPGNGDVARRMITAFARLRDPELADWIEDTVPFPNSMVDRITPATTPEDIATLQREHGITDAWPVVCEPFTQWVLEDSFGDGRPAWDEAGVHLVEDVEPYELMKIRLLNGSHQAMAYLGYLAGHRYTHEVCTDPLFVSFLQRYMAEAAPTVPEVPGIDLADYQRQLLERFASPAVRDTLARLCAETSDRIPKFVLPTIREQLRRGGPVAAGAHVVAAWARYAEGTDEQGAAIEVVDRRREELAAAAANHGTDILAFLRDRELFGDLIDHEEFTTAYTRALEGLRSSGTRETVAALMADSQQEDTP